MIKRNSYMRLNRLLLLLIHSVNEEKDSLFMILLAGMLRAKVVVRYSLSLYQSVQCVMRRSNQRPPTCPVHLPENLPSAGESKVGT